MINNFKFFLQISLLVLLLVSCRNSGSRSVNAGNSTAAEEKETLFRQGGRGFTYESGAIIRGDTSSKRIALVFTADEFADGGEFIAETLKEHKINGSFFFTGNFYRNARFRDIILQLKNNGNYMGSHSDRHLLYCDWTKRDSLLVSRAEFRHDLKASYEEMKKFEINPEDALIFLPPYEWYNDSITLWTRQMGLELVNFSPGTRSNADYTYPEMAEKYLDSPTIFRSVLDYELNSRNGLNGFILLVHTGTDPRRTDKFYRFLPGLIDTLTSRGYQFVRIDDLLK